MKLIMSLSSQWILAAAMILGLAGCGQEEAASEAPLRKVRFIEVSEEMGGIVRTFSGSSQSAQQSRMSFKVPGTIVELPIQVGDNLRRGDLIARLDPSEYQLQAQQAQASLAQAEASARNADANYDRVKGLYENTNASRNDLDSARANSESAKALSSAAEKALELTNLSVSYTRLTAGMDCSVASVIVDLNENISTGATVAEVNCGSDLEVKFDVPESVIGEILQGMVAVIRFTAVPDQLFSGLVKQVAVAATQEVTFPVVVAIDGSNPQLRPGLAAEVVLEFERKGPDVHLLPLSSIVNRSDGTFVYIAEQDGDEAVLSLRLVEVAELTESGVEITKGLSMGDLVVTAGVSVVRAGQRVQIEID
jgi:multidrug efflux system membrane fusion protein